MRDRTKESARLGQAKYMKLPKARREASELRAEKYFSGRRGNPKFGDASRKCSKKTRPGTPKFGKCMSKALKKKRR